MKLLIIGGSGFVSGTLARTAVANGHEVLTITRGQKPTPAGVHTLVADRNNREVFADVVGKLKLHWDMVVDCIGYVPEDAMQDINVFRDRASHLVFISTDFVFDPAFRKFPQPEESEHFAQTGYGGNKRLCELELERGDLHDMAYTVFRPCHIYGPGSELGCLPNNARDPELLHKIMTGVALELVGGGHFLQQPIFAEDLAKLVLSAFGNPDSYGRIFNSAGPDIIESVQYYRIIGQVLGVDIKVKEIPVDETLAAKPELAPFLTHRIYDLSSIKRAGLETPSTSIESGLKQHTNHLLNI